MSHKRIAIKSKKSYTHHNFVDCFTIVANPEPHIAVAANLVRNYVKGLALFNEMSFAHLSC